MSSVRNQQPLRGWGGFPSEPEILFSFAFLDMKNSNFPSKSTNNFLLTKGSVYLFFASSRSRNFIL